MRPLSASSYSLLLRLSCPILVTPASDMNEQLRAATLWHFVHTADIDWLERASDAEIHHAAAVQGHKIPLESYRDLFKTMTAEMERMKAAFVEAESPGDPFSTTPTSPTSESVSSGPESAAVTIPASSAGTGRSISSSASSTPRCAGTA